jgi:hypothetical protein
MKIIPLFGTRHKLLRFVPGSIEVNGFPLKYRIENMFFIKILYFDQINATKLKNNFLHFSLKISVL